MSAVYTLFLSIIILSYLGYYLDKKMHSFPLIFLLGFVLGSLLGFYQLMKITNSQKNNAN